MFQIHIHTQNDKYVDKCMQKYDLFFSRWFSKEWIEQCKVLLASSCENAACCEQVKGLTTTKATI